MQPYSPHRAALAWQGRGRWGGDRDLLFIKIDPCYYSRWRALARRGRHLLFAQLNAWALGAVPSVTYGRSDHFKLQTQFSLSF